MKVLILALALCASAGLYADTNPQLSNLNAAVVPSSSGADTYALSNATPTVRSSMIDLASYGGLFVSLTGVASTSVDVLWAAAADSAAPTSGIRLSPGQHLFIAKQARYIGFRVVPALQGSVWGAPTPKVSVFYTLVSGGVAVAQPTTPASITMTASTAWTYATLSPGDFSFQNNSNIDFRWWQGPSTMTAPDVAGFTAYAGQALPANVPVTVGTPRFFWSTTTTGATIYGQSHY